eukprot:167983_1
MITRRFKTNYILSKYDIDKNKWTHLKLKDNKKIKYDDDAALWSSNPSDIYDVQNTFEPILWYNDNINIIQIFKAPNVYQFMDLLKKKKKWVKSNLSVNDAHKYYQAFC